MQLSPQTLITKVGENINADLGDGVLINMNIQLGRYYELNPVAAHVLAKLEQPQTRQQLVNSVQAEFEVSEETCTRDVDTFLGRLLELGLITAQNPAAQAASA